MAGGSLTGRRESTSENTPKPAMPTAHTSRVCSIPSASTPAPTTASDRALIAKHRPAPTAVTGPCPVDRPDGVDAGRHIALRRQPGEAIEVVSPSVVVELGRRTEVVDHHLQLAQSIASRWPGRQGDDAGDEPALLVLLPHPRGWPQRDLRCRRRTTIDTGRVFRSTRTRPNQSAPHPCRARWRPKGSAKPCQPRPRNLCGFCRRVGRRGSP